MTALDRTAALGVFSRFQIMGPDWSEKKDVELLDALESCVRPGPPHTIDRDALTRLLLDGREPNDAFALRDAVLALLRPVEGVVLTREEAEYAARWLPTRNSVTARRLAARLEAAS